MNDRDVGGTQESALTRAEHLLEIHRPQEALRAVARELARDPQNVTALGLAARAELDLNEPQRAREFATRAAAAQPHAEYPLRLLALALHALGRFADSCEAAQAAVANAPNVWQTHYALAHVSAGTPGMASVAREAARRAVELAPLEAETHAVMGQVAVEEGDKATAEKALREALRLDPNLTMARNDLGRLHLLRKDHFGAAGHFAQAAAGDVRMQVAQRNIDAAIAMAVGRVVFWVYIAAFVLARFAVKEHSDEAIWAGYALLAVLVGLTIWQAVLIVPAARGGLGTYLRMLPHRDRLMTATVALLVLGMSALMVMCVVPPDSRLWPLVVGAPALIASRLLLEMRARALQGTAGGPQIR
jgi:tetratricopeptide (TPR) repeat protein